MRLKYLIDRRNLIMSYQEDLQRDVLENFIKISSEILSFKPSEFNSAHYTADHDFNYYLAIQNHIESIQKYLSDIKIKTNNYKDFWVKILDGLLVVELTNDLNKLYEQIIQIKILYNQNKFPTSTNMQFLQTHFIECRSRALQIIQVLDFIETQEKTEKINKEYGFAVSNAADIEISKHFSKSSESFKLYNLFWLLVIIGIVFLLLFFILKFDQIFVKNFTFYEKIIPSELNVISYISTRISFIAMLLIALFFSIKNYSVNKYNSIVNEYKANVMKTLPAIFIQYPDTKKEIFLDKLADFLFKLPDTGMSKNTDGGMPYDKVIDMLTKILGQKPDKH